MLELGGHRVRLTNLQKIVFADGGITKRAVLQYYLDVGPMLLPHLAQRAIVMKRYPNGANGQFFFMKRAPLPRPKWIHTCHIEHASGTVIESPLVDDLASLAWVVNLGCIELNPWYSRCDDVDRPDYLHFELDPGDAPFERVCEVALALHDALTALRMPNYAKTIGAKSLHVSVPLLRGPTQTKVWNVAKALARDLAERHPKTITAECRIAHRPAGRVLVDYNQNVWGRTVASVYSVRAEPRATVSTPVTWDELSAGVTLDSFGLDDVPARVKKLGDLWAPLSPSEAGRFDLTEVE